MDTGNKIVVGAEHHRENRLLYKDDRAQVTLFQAATGVIDQSGLGEMIDGSLFKAQFVARCKSIWLWSWLSERKFAWLWPWLPGVSLSGCGHCCQNVSVPGCGHHASYVVVRGGNARCQEQSSHTTRAYAATLGERGYLQCDGSVGHCVLASEPTPELQEATVAICIKQHRLVGEAPLGASELHEIDIALNVIAVPYRCKLQAISCSS